MAGTEINNDPDGKKVAAEAESKARKEMLKSIPGMEVESALKRGLNHVITKSLPDEVNEIRWRGIWKSLPFVGTIVDWMDKTHWLRHWLGMNKEK